MRPPPAWTPRLAPGQGLAHERLAAALIEDVLSGAIPPGARLPAHRALAAQLQLGVGSVTRAYATLQRRGLARSEHGRGMFVLAPPARAPARIDFSLNLPPPMLTQRMLLDMLAATGVLLDPQAMATYGPPAGLPQDRAAMAAHLAARRGLAAEPDRLLLTAGAQHALFVAFHTVPPGPVAVEALTYPLALAALRQMGRAVLPLAMDSEGVLPGALEAALRGPAPPAAVYLVPTLQNPTGATMGEARRRALVALARAHELPIIEDDVYAVLAPRAGPALATLAPERTLYVSSLSKSLAPGLRIGALVCPAAWVTRACDGLQATQSMASPLAAAMLRHVLADGLIDSVAQSIRAEAARRNRLAREVLGAVAAPTGEGALHLWLPLGTARSAEVVRRAAARNLVLAPPEAFMPDPAGAEAGLRLCLGAVPEEALRPGLELVAELLAGRHPARLDEGAIV